MISAKRSLLEACHTPEFHSGLSRVGFLKRRVHVSTIERGDIKSPSRLMQISICERRCVKNYRALSRTRFHLPAGIRESETKLLLEEEVWGPV